MCKVAVVLSSSGSEASAVQKLSGTVLSPGQTESQVVAGSKVQTCIDLWLLALVGPNGEKLAPTRGQI